MRVALFVIPLAIAALWFAGCQKEVREVQRPQGDSAQLAQR